MKLLSTLAAVAATWVATAGHALALPTCSGAACGPLTVPEPGTAALVGLAVAGVAYIAKRNKR